MTAAFEAVHRQRFGFLMPGRPLVVEALSAEAIGVAESGDASRRRRAGQRGPAAGRARARPGSTAAGATRRSGDRDELRAGRRRRRPGDHRRGERDDRRRARLAGGDHRAPRPPAQPRPAAPGRRRRSAPRADPVMLEVFNNLFMSIAEQMGAALANTAQSVNIKERLDFSCAVFDRDGGLVANAPHLPVHLGSMGESVETVIRERRGTMRPGDVYVLNAPYNGGTHLPDITVITPVFDEAGRRDPVLRRLARPPRRHRRHHARLDAARQPQHRRGGRADRQLRCWSSRAASARRRCARC